MRPPRPGLLGAIQAELADDEPLVSERIGPPTPVPGTSAAHGTRKRAHTRRARWLVAAAAVVVVGVGATVAYRQTSEDVLASAVLTPLPAKSGSGTAQVVRGRDGQELAVSITAVSPADAFEEVWLFDSTSGGMISVGIVPSNGKGTFPLPSSSRALDGYTVVDVSLEPFDGNPAHSHNSILRGTLS